MVLSKWLQLVNIMCIWETKHPVIYGLFTIKINEALYGQVTGYHILLHQIKSHVRWFQIRFD